MENAGIDTGAPGGRGANAAPPLSDARRRLLEGAEAQFAEKGFYGASIRDIANAVGLSKASVLHHYESKEALYGAVLARLAASLDSVRRDMVVAGETRAALTALIDGFVAWSLAQPVYAHIMLRELLDNAGRAASAERWYLADFVNDCAALLARAQRQGLVAGGHPVAMLETLLALPAYHLAAGPTRARIIGEAASGQADLAFRAEATALVRRAWGLGEEAP